MLAVEQRSLHSEQLTESQRNTSYSRCPRLVHQGRIPPGHQHDTVAQQSKPKPSIVGLDLGTSGTTRDVWLLWLEAGAQSLLPDQVPMTPKTPKRRPLYCEVSASKTHKSAFSTGIQDSSSGVLVIGRSSGLNGMQLLPQLTYSSKAEEDVVPTSPRQVAMLPPTP